MGYIGKGAAAIMGLTYGGHMAAQSFASPVTNPFGLPASQTYQLNPTFADLDADGDQDLMRGGYREMTYYENTGDSLSPQFASPQVNPYGLVNTPYEVLPHFMDMDSDGDMDVLAAVYPIGFEYFENTGTPSAPQFASPVFNPFSLAPGDSVPAIIASADLDDDGDIDLLTGGSNGSFNFFENTGTGAAAQFAAPQRNPFSLSSVYYYAFPAFVDLDEDGDFDLLAGEYYSYGSVYGNFQYFENTGSKTNPQFAAPRKNPFGLTPVTYLALPAFANLDGDGDMDLLVVEYYGATNYYENTSTISLREKSLGNGFAVFPNPAIDYIAFQNPGQVESVEVTNAAGVLVLESREVYKRLPIGDLAPGAYTVKIRDNDGTVQSAPFTKR